MVTDLRRGFIPPGIRQVHEDGGNFHAGRVGKQARISDW